MYSIGVLIHKIHLFETQRATTLLFIFLLNVLICLAVLWFVDTGRAFEYVSPFMVVNAIILVIVFYKIKLNLKTEKIIRKLAPLAFGIYLFQMNYVIWNDCINHSFAFLSEMQLLSGVGMLIVSSLGVFFCGLVVEALRMYFHKLLCVPKLCYWIVSILKRICSIAVAWIR